MGGPRRRWSASVARGGVVGHPAVLAAIAQGCPGTHPERRLHQGTMVITYRRARVWMDRDAWEMLPNDGILVQWIVPTSGDPWVIALSHDELHEVFGEVVGTKSWEQYRCWHFPTPPRAAASFKVHTNLPGVPPQAARSAPQRAKAPAPKPNKRTDGPLAPEQALAKVAAHLQQHGQASEAQLVTLVGSARAYRMVQRKRDELPLPPGKALRVEATSEGTFWRVVPA